MSEDQSQDLSPETLLQYRIQAAFAETMMGEGSAVLALSETQLDWLREQAEADKSPVARSLLLLVQLAQRSRTDDVSAGQEGVVLPFGRSDRVLSQDASLMSINMAHLLTRL